MNKQGCSLYFTINITSVFLLIFNFTLFMSKSIAKMQIQFHGKVLFLFLE